MLLFLVVLNVVNALNSNINDVLYPVNSLTNAGSLYPLGGKLPTSRLHHTIAHVNNYIVVYGGYSIDASILDDINLYDERSQTWSNPILRFECCDNNGQVLDVTGLEENIKLPFVGQGFQGDIPLGRAEHISAAIDNKMYVFGGVTSLYGFTQDMYSFDLDLLAWRKIDTSIGPIPNRRAGHSAVVDNNENLYVFGGRTSFTSNSQDTRVIGLSDLWSYDINVNSWTKLSSTVSYPCGRQHVALAYIKNIVYLFGGIDPSSNLTFNDVWAYNLAQSQWQELSPNSGSIAGFSPPPLFGAHLFPSTVSSFENVNGTVLTNQTTSLLIYGGTGGGGSCGGTACGRVETVLGQVYKFTVTRQFWQNQHPNPSSDNSADLQTTLTQAWTYARLTSQEPSQQGRVRKLYGYEQAVLVTSRGLIFEFGGLQGVPIRLAQNNQSALNRNEVTQALGLDAGGELYGTTDTATWDLTTGEQLKYRVDLPSNGPWEYQDAFIQSQPQLNFTTILFHRKMRIFTLAPSDIVLIRTDVFNL